MYSGKTGAEVEEFVKAKKVDGLESDIFASQCIQFNTCQRDS
ncbi:hypothetical protein JCM19237_5728 [Photobacterium aphoticum]|uniref:Uncharacterized protein n=1 Tax=Photobacterium aphoticum TaxID=754436 RepID=A0A090QI62_9GAMM|nr:hypothetical protein JCM19237_5728 [Photobacterium aphoticum]